MEKTEKELLNQIEKWTRKIENRRKKVVLADTKGENSLKNIDAYISDSRHFLNKRDYIRSFECLIYAWGIFETMIELGFLEKNND
jgi:uncharacterized protein